MSISNRYLNNSFKSKKYPSYVESNSSGFYGINMYPEQSKTERFKKPVINDPCDLLCFKSGQFLLKYVSIIYKRLREIFKKFYDKQKNRTISDSNENEVQKSYKILPIMFYPFLRVPSCTLWNKTATKYSYMTRTQMLYEIIPFDYYPSTNNSVSLEKIALDSFAIRSKVLGNENNFAYHNEPLDPDFQPIKGKVQLFDFSCKRGDIKSMKQCPNLNILIDGIEIKNSKTLCVLENISNSMLNGNGDCKSGEANLYSIIKRLQYDNNYTRDGLKEMSNLELDKFKIYSIPYISNDLIIKTPLDIGNPASAKAIQSLLPNLTGMTCYSDQLKQFSAQKFLSKETPTEMAFKNIVPSLKDFTYGKDLIVKPMMYDKTSNLLNAISSSETIAIHLSNLCKSEPIWMDFASLIGKNPVPLDLNIPTSIEIKENEEKLKIKSFPILYSTLTSLKRSSKYRTMPSYHQKVAASDSPKRQHVESPEIFDDSQSYLSTNSSVQSTITKNTNKQRLDKKSKNLQTSNSCSLFQLKAEYTQPSNHRPKRPSSHSDINLNVNEPCVTLNQNSNVHLGELRKL